MAYGEGQRARSNLRIADLKQRMRLSEHSLKVKIPTTVYDAVTRMARQLGVTKADVMVALLNAGLEAVPKLKVPKRS